MSKKTEMEEKIAKLKRLQAEATEARVKLEAEALRLQKEAEDIIPVIQKEIAGFDAKIAGLQGQIAEQQAQKSERLETLKALGIKVKGVKGKGRGGGYKGKLQGLMRAVGVGATITNKDVQEHLGSVSGYVGMLIGEEITDGNLQRTTAGVYKVTGIPA